MSASAAAVALHFAHYNLVRVHKTLRMTPAMAHGVAGHIWTIEELISRALAEKDKDRLSA